MSSSPNVLKAVARALQLDELERDHLMDLSRTAAPTGRTRRRQPKFRESVQLLLDAMTGAAAFLRNARSDCWPPTVSDGPSTTPPSPTPDRIPPEGSLTMADQPT